MPITTNNGGVLKKLGTVSVNDSGVIRNLGTVSANDSGVIRTIHSANKLKISGITPLVTAEDHIVIVNSGTFNLTAPAGTRIIVGSGAVSYVGGYVAEHTLAVALNNARCTATIAEAEQRFENASKLVVAGVTYGCGKVEQVIQSKWGPIGGRGGNNNGGNYGAGGGAGQIVFYQWLSTQREGEQGGNNGGYGNFGGNGFGYQGGAATAGASGAAGTGLFYQYVEDDDGFSNLRFDYYPSGGGGYAAGGGQLEQDEEGAEETYGQPGSGIIVIEF